jgi:hypothetical protein
MTTSIAATVDAFNQALAAAPVAPDPPVAAAPPGWLNGGVAGVITIPSLKASIMAHVQAEGGGGGVVGNALIAPNTIMQYKNCAASFSGIGCEPFFRQYAVCPIGRHYVLADRRTNTTGVADPIQAPPAGLGVPVFA